MESQTPIRNEQPQTKASLGVPIAIVIAGILVAGAIMYSNKAPTSPSVAAVSTDLAYNEYVVEPLGEKDHILGNSDAKVVVFEYSDTECPFCKQAHLTLHQLVDKYGKDGNVAWVYRHLPLYKEDSSGRALHSKALPEAEALECAAELGGNEKFWQYTDEVYRVTPSNNGLDLAKLPQIAGEIGLDVAKFTTCQNSRKYTAKIEEEYLKAGKAGGRGTPHIVIDFRKGLSEKKAKAILKAVGVEFAKIAPNSNLPQNFFSWNKDRSRLTYSGALPYPLMDVIVKTALDIK